MDNYPRQIKNYKKMNIEEKENFDEALAGLGNRISKIAELTGGKKNLANAIGISESQLYRYIAGDSQPTVEPLAAMAKIANVHLDWLVFGEGPTGISPEVHDFKSLYATRKQYITIPEYQYDNPEVKNELSSSLGKVSFNQLWLMKIGLNPDSLRLLRAYGDSMAPTINDGDLLMIDIGQNRFTGDAIYILKLDPHCLVAKRLQQAVDKGLYLVNDNPAYREQHIPNSERDSLEIIGKVIWSAGLV